MGKKAFVFIIDASPAMQEPFAKKSSGPKTLPRLEAARFAVGTFCARVLQDKVDNQVGVILTHQAETDHAFLHTAEADEFHNLVMIPSSGLTEPNLDYLQSIQEADLSGTTPSDGGDLMDAIHLATHTLDKLTGRKTTFDGGHRHIVVLTPCATQETLHVPTHLEDVETMRSLDTRLTVLGLNDCHSQDKLFAEATADGTAFFDKLEAPSSDKQQEEESSQATEETAEEQDEESETDENDDDEEEESSQEQQEEVDSNVRIFKKQQDLETMWLSFVQKTGGRLASMNSLEELCHFDLLTMSATPTHKLALKKAATYLQIAPNLPKILVKKVNLLAPQNPGALKKSLISLDYNKVHAGQQPSGDIPVKEEPTSPEAMAAAANDSGGGVQDDADLKPAAARETSDSAVGGVGGGTTVATSGVTIPDAVASAAAAAPEPKPSPVVSSKQQDALSALFNGTKKFAQLPPFAFNGAGQLMLEDFKTSTYDVADEARDKPIDIEEVAKAIPYGKDLVPVSHVDYAGLTKASPDKAIFRIACYMARSKIPFECLVGPPIAMIGDDSERACAAISALAQALHRLDKVAIGVFYKSSGANAVGTLGALFPLPEKQPDGQSSSSQPLRLVFLQLPFSGEVNDLNLSEVLEETATASAEAANPDDAKAKVCDDLIDSLMLSDEQLDSTAIPNPFVEAFNEAIVRRAVFQKAKLPVPRSFDSNDPMVTPPEVLERAQPALESFRRAFPFKEIKVEKKGKARADKKKSFNFRSY